MMRRTVISLLLSLVVGWPLLLRAQPSEAVPEYTMKAAYLYNFALLTTWPQPTAASGQDFNLCFYGQDDFGPALDKLSGKDVNGQKIKVLRLDRPEDALRCQLIFISESNTNRLNRLSDVLGSAPVLTVADDKLSQGVMISLTPQNQRLTFAINAGAAKSAKLQLSSKLMRLASHVVTP
jgi:hypothetical protein